MTLPLAVVRLLSQSIAQALKFPAIVTEFFPRTSVYSASVCLSICTRRKIASAKVNRSEFNTRVALSCWDKSHARRMRLPNCCCAPLMPLISGVYLAWLSEHHYVNRQFSDILLEHILCCPTMLYIYLHTPHTLSLLILPRVLNGQFLAVNGWLWDLRRFLHIPQHGLLMPSPSQWPAS